MENPETVGMGVLALGVITAWFKMKPAMKKIESEEDASLRTDLMKMVSDAKADLASERKSHQDIVQSMRTEHELALMALSERHMAICAEYENKLQAFQRRVDDLMDRLIEQTARKLT